MNTTSTTLAYNEELRPSITMELYSPCMANAITIEYWRALKEMGDPRAVKGVRRNGLISYHLLQGLAKSDPQ